jgi:hypothetical protein
VPQALVYLGPDRRLIMRFNTAGRIDATEQLTIGPWSALLEPGRARGYRATLQHRAAPGDPAAPAASLSTPILVEAYGFSRAELVAAIASLRIFDLEALSVQNGIFIHPGGPAPAARYSGSPLGSLP